MRGVADESWMQSMEGDDRVFIAFNLEPKEDEAASLEQGRKVCRDVEYISIQVPGDRGNMVHRPITPEDKQRFGRQYADWKAGLTPTESGTLLKDWPGITRSEVEELAYFKIRTVEQLASLSDGNAQNVGPIRALREKAKLFLEAAKGQAPLLKLQEELKKRENENATLKVQLEEQAKELAELKADMKAFRKKAG